MRHKDPELMKKISRFIENFYGSRSRMPSTAEIAGEMHVAKSTAYNYLVAMVLSLSFMRRAIPWRMKGSRMEIFW